MSEDGRYEKDLRDLINAAKKSATKLLDVRKEKMGRSAVFGMTKHFILKKIMQKF